MEQELPKNHLSHIPGIGIIRQRSLAKAGWANLDDLCKATKEDLLGVPGLTEVKADQILVFLAEYRASSKPAKGKGKGKQTKDVPPAAIPQAPAPAPETADEPRPAASFYSALKDVAANAQRVATRSEWLNPKSELAAQLARWVALPERVDESGQPSPKRLARCVEAAVSAQTILGELSLSIDVKKKRQESCAEGLKEARRAIQQALEAKK